MRVDQTQWQSVSWEDLAALVSPRIMSRGRDYLARGQVKDCIVCGASMAGSVLGTSGWYNVRVDLEDGRIEASCTCPCQFAPCKHAVALVLAWLNEPSGFLDLGGTVLPEEKEDLVRICRELCLAAPGRAVDLLSGKRTGGGACEAGVAALARNLLSGGRLALGDLESLAERLDWIGARLAESLATDGREAAAAAMELAASLTAVWVESGSSPRLTAIIGNYLIRLAAAWPERVADRPPLIGPAEIEAICRPEMAALAGETARLLAAAGCELPAAAPSFLGGVLTLWREGPAGAATAPLESLLLLLDAYERWGWRREAAVMARAGLRRPNDADRYLLRGRLARYHEFLGERRQALAHLIANFEARPDIEGWAALRRTAVTAGEWPRVKRRIWPVVLAGDKALRGRAALDEDDPQLLRAIAGEYGTADTGAVEVWSRLAHFDAESGLAFLLAGTKDAVARGGRDGRRQAAACLRALGKTCRRNGWLDRWAEIRQAIKEEFGPLVNWPELGSLLATEDPADLT